MVKTTDPEVVHAARQVILLDRKIHNLRLESTIFKNVLKKQANGGAYLIHIPDLGDVRIVTLPGGSRVRTRIRHNI